MHARMHASSGHRSSPTNSGMQTHLVNGNLKAPVGMLGHRRGGEGRRAARCGLCNPRGGGCLLQDLHGQRGHGQTHGAVGGGGDERGNLLVRHACGVHTIHLQYQQEISTEIVTTLFREGSGVIIVVEYLRSRVIGFANRKIGQEEP